VTSSFAVEAKNATEAVRMVQDGDGAYLKSEIGQNSETADPTYEVDGVRWDELSEAEDDAEEEGAAS
jgi:hypothetical protein